MTDWNARFANVSPIEVYVHHRFGPELGLFGDDAAPGTGVKAVTSKSIIADAIRAFDEASKALKLAIPTETADLALGQVLFESAFGRSGTLGGNDWGAFQAGMSKAGKPQWIASFLAKYKNGPKGVGGLAHRDSVPATGGKAGYNFVAYYRIYPSQYVAAEDWLSAMGKRLGISASMNAEEYATRAYLTGYFGGIHDGARPVGQRSEPYNDAELANIADYARLVGANAAKVSAVRESGTKGRDPHTIDFPSIVPWYRRLSAGSVSSGASAATMIAAAQKAFPKGNALGDAYALAKTNGLAWVLGPPPGYKADGTKGSKLGTVFKIGAGIAFTGLAVSIATHKS